MIQKIGLSLIKNSSNRLNKVVNKSHIKQFGVKTKSIFGHEKPVSKLERFFVELCEKMRAFFRKFTKKDELQKSKKPSIAKETNSQMQNRLELERKNRVVVEIRARDAEKEIKQAGHDPKPGDIDSNGYLTCSGKDKVSHPNFKGHRDDGNNLEQNIEKHLEKQHDTKSNSIDIEDKYTDIIYGKNTHDFEPHPESLVDAVQENQVRRHHLEQNVDDVIEHRHHFEQYADDVIEHTPLDDINDLPDELFD